MSDRWVKRYLASIVLVGVAAIAIVWANATFPPGQEFRPRRRDSMGLVVGIPVAVALVWFLVAVARRAPSSTAARLAAAAWSASTTLLSAIPACALLGLLYHRGGENVAVVAMLLGIGGTVSSAWIRSSLLPGRLAMGRDLPPARSALLAAWKTQGRTVDREHW